MRRPGEGPPSARAVAGRTAAYAESAPISARGRIRTARCTASRNVGSSGRTSHVRPGAGPQRGPAAGPGPGLNSTRTCRGRRTPRKGSGSRQVSERHPADSTHASVKVAAGSNLKRQHRTFGPTPARKHDSAAAEPAAQTDSEVPRVTDPGEGAQWPASPWATPGPLYSRTTQGGDRQ